MRRDLRRWHGLAKLVTDTVEHGSRAVERVHLGTAKRPFAVLEAIPPTAPTAVIVHQIHDSVATTVYSMVRGVNRVVIATIDIGFAVASAVGPADSDGEGDMATERTAKLEDSGPS